MRREKEDALDTPKQSRGVRNWTRGAAKIGTCATDTKEMTLCAARNGLLDLIKAGDLSQSVRLCATYLAVFPSRSSATASTASPKSPIKSMADLHMARRPTECHWMDVEATVEADSIPVHCPNISAD